MRRWVPSAVVIAATLVLVAASLWALTPPSRAGQLARFLPADGTASDWRSTTGVGYGVEQAVVDGPDAVVDLPSPITSAAGIDDATPVLRGRVLRASINRDQAAAQTQTLDFSQVGDRLELIDNRYPGGFSVTTPALPVLDSALLAGRTASYAGRRHGPDHEVAMTATITVVASRHVAGCLDSIADQRFGQPETRIVQTLIFCPDGQPTPGFAGLLTETDGETSGAMVSPRPISRPSVSLADADYSLTPTGTGRPLQFYEAFGDLWPLEVGSGRLGIAAGQLVLAQNDGDVLAFARAHDAAPGTEDLRWRSRPGGVITAFATAGELTVVATSLRRIVAYDGRGQRRWSLDTADVVTGLARVDDRLAAISVDGRVLLLDLVDGHLRWSAAVGADVRAGVSASTELVGVVADGGLLALAVADGRPRWQTTITDTVRVAVGPSVGEGETGTLIARDPRSGEPQWQRGLTGNLDSLASLGGLIVARTNLGMFGYDQSGRLAWRAPAGLNWSPTTAGVFIGQSDRLELIGTDGTARGRWSIDPPVSGYGNIVIGPAGAVGSTLGTSGERTFWVWS